VQGVLYGSMPASNSSPELQAWTSVFTPARLTDEAITRGLCSTTWPGRLQVVHLPLGAPGTGIQAAILDGGHNEQAIPSLAAGLDAVGARTGARHLHVLFACGCTRDGAAFLQALLQQMQGQFTRVSVDCTSYTTPEGMPWAACMSPGALADKVTAVLGPSIPVTFHFSLEAGWTSMAATGQAGDDTLVAILGSLYLVSDVHRWLSQLQASV
jgi:folylpolyglutamate synthase/dihydropteroate synthase